MRVGNDAQLLRRVHRDGERARRLRAGGPADRLRPRGVQLRRGEPARASSPRGRATVEIASGILPIYSRTPALTAMTAAGLDFVSGGRFTLGLGASGPQVIEGWHGVPYDAPVGRTRELIEICRDGLAARAPRVPRQALHAPAAADQGTGLGKPLKLINHPVRERIPIVVAALGPKNVALAAELAEGWQPIFYFPEKAGLTWDAALAEGTAKRDTATLGPLDVIAAAPLAIGDDVAHLRDLMRPALALYIGGMGARGKNFYHDLACRYGYAEGGGPDPGRLPGRPQGRGRRPGSRRAGREDLAHRPARLRQGAPRRLPGGRRHHPQRHRAFADPRPPRQGHRDRPRPRLITAIGGRRARHIPHHRAGLVGRPSREDNSKKNRQSIIPNECVPAPGPPPAFSVTQKADGVITARSAWLRPLATKRGRKVDRWKPTRPVRACGRPRRSRTPRPGSAAAPWSPAAIPRPGPPRAARARGRRTRATRTRPRPAICIGIPASR